MEKGAAEDLSLFANSDEIYNVATMVIHEPRWDLQGGAANHLQGFEDDNLGSSAGGLGQ